MRKYLLAAGLAAMVLSVPGIVRASGTAIYEQGSKAAAQAGAFVARADDATALFFNPAGMAFMKEGSFAFNLTYIHPSVKYESPTVGSWDDQAKNFFIPGLYYVQPINDRVVFGFSANAPYDLSTDWSSNFPGHWVSQHAKITTIDYHPAFAFKIDDHNSLSIGLDYYDSKLELNRFQDTSALTTAVNGMLGNFYPSPPYPPGIPVYAPSYAYLTSNFRDQAFGWDVGYMYKGDPWSFGLTYKSKASFSYAGHTYFYPSPNFGPGAAYLPGQDASMDLDSVPAVAAAGFAWKGAPWTVEFDVTWTQWSSWGRSTAHFSNPTLAVPATETFIFDWKNTWSYRLGFGYKLNPNWELRWGVLYDQAPVPDQTRSPVLPDSDRWSVQFGTGYTNKKFTFDWFAMYLKFKNAPISQDNIYRYGSSGLPSPPYPGMYPVTPDGSYKGSAILAGMQIGYHF